LYRLQGSDNLDLFRNAKDLSENSSGKRRVPEKNCQNVFVMSSIKLGRIGQNLAENVLNKFVIKWCKCFPFHVNSVSK